MKHALHQSLLLLLFAALTPTDGWAAPPRTEMRLPPPDRCSEPTRAPAGLERITLFGSSRVCYAAAVDLVARALDAARGGEAPFALSRDRGLPCNVRCWFNRETAVLVDALTNPDGWPEPPALPAGRFWVFFVASPDLSGHWHWIAVREQLTQDGRALVYLWTER